MLHAISLELAPALKARGVPFPVVYGPERLDVMSVGKTRIVLERDRGGGDSVGAGRARTRNPRLILTRGIGFVLRVFAQSTESGAGVWNHERLADSIVDKVLVCLTGIIEERRTLWRIASSGLVPAIELSQVGLERWPGVVYQITGSIDRGVADTSWSDAAAPEITLGEGGVPLSSSVRVRTDGGTAWEPVPPGG